MKDIKVNLLQGKYKEAEKICGSMDDAEIKNMLMTIAYETESIYVYSFIQYMAEKTKNIYWTELAIDVMLNPLCYIEGAYSVALFHVRQALAYNKTVENMERIIFFYSIPEKLIDEAEAEYMAQEILKIEPDNKLALGLLQRL